MKRGEEILADEYEKTFGECEAVQLIRDGKERGALAIHAVRAIESARREAWNEAIETAARKAECATSRSPQQLGKAIRSLHREE